MGKYFSAQAQRGFTLVELMIVVTVVGLLTAIAIPGYQDYVIRAKVTEGLFLAAGAKVQIAEAFQSQGVGGVPGEADVFNASPIASRSSKYVSAVTIDRASGSIQVAFLGNSANGLVAINGTTIWLHPNIQNSVPVVGIHGVMDWACTSLSNTTATRRGLSNRGLGTLPAKYAPTECA